MEKAAFVLLYEALAHSLFTIDASSPSAVRARGPVRGLADAHALVVQVGAAPARGGEQIVARRIVDDRLRDHAAVAQRDGNAILREAVDEIGGAVERVDDPLVFRLSGCAAFL